MGTATVIEEKIMLTLPGDAVRQIQWRFADRFDLQMLVQSARGVARSTVARLVAAGERNTHEWTPGKSEMMEAFDRAGVTAAFMEPEEGGFIVGPKNLALSLAAFELAWVDGGAATASLAGFLALSPIHERGTPEQVSHYKSLSAPPQPGEDRKPWRGAFVLTEPIPYVGVDASMLSGKMRVAEWKDGEEPWLQVDKRGRFITNIAFANFVTAAVASDDPRIKGSCMVILEDTDEGTFDHGTPTKKLVHQLSSTGDPIFNLKVPASRIVGGYTVKDGVIVPNYNHGEIIEAVFRRTRVPVGIMTAAKLLSAVEPVIRYQRGRFRGAEGTTPGSVRYEQGIQQREDALHRLVDVWATGEAATSLGFATARLFDDLDPIEKQKSAILKERGIQGGRAEFKALKESEQRAIELVSLIAQNSDAPRRHELEADPLVQFMLKDAEAKDVYKRQLQERAQSRIQSSYRLRSILALSGQPPAGRERERIAAFSLSAPRGQALDRMFLYHLRAPSFRLFSGERVGNHQTQKNEITRSGTWACSCGYCYFCSVRMYATTSLICASVSLPA